MSVHRHGPPYVPATTDVLVAISAHDVGQEARAGKHDGMRPVLADFRRRRGVARAGGGSEALGE